MVTRNKKKIVDGRFAHRSSEYGSVIKRIQNDGECPFCKQNFKYHKEKILKWKGTWFITKNSWPYKNVQYHFLLLNYNEHKEELKELNKSDYESIFTLAAWAVKKFKLKGGAICMRFGETSHTGATVCHIHGHLIVPKLKSKSEAITVNFPIG